MDDNFKFAQHLANAAYDYEMAHGGNGVKASLAYSQTFALEMHRADIERAYGKIMAIYAATDDFLAEELANEAMTLLDKPLGQQSFDYSLDS